MRDFLTNLLHGAGDCTPVCTTELGKIASYNPGFEERGVKLFGLSTDSVEGYSVLHGMCTYYCFHFMYVNTFSNHISF